MGWFSEASEAIVQKGRREKHRLYAFKLLHELVNTSF